MLVFTENFFVLTTRSRETRMGGHFFSFLRYYMQKVGVSTAYISLSLDIVNSTKTFFRNFYRLLEEMCVQLSSTYTTPFSTHQGMAFQGGKCLPSGNNLI